MNTTAKLIAGLALASVSTMSLADFHINVGTISVIPNDSSTHLNAVESVVGLDANSTEAAVNTNTQLGLIIDYDIDANWVVELIAATPFSHDVKLKGSAASGLNIGNVKQLPPTLLAQYHFGSVGDEFRPFVGLGLNYTVFFDESLSSDLSDELIASEAGIAKEGDLFALKLDDSFGLAAQVGANYKLDETWGLHFTATYIDIDSTAEVKINGTTVQAVDVEIDPLVIMAGLRYSF